MHVNQSVALADVCVHNLPGLSKVKVHSDLGGDVRDCAGARCSHCSHRIAAAITAAAAVAAVACVQQWHVACVQQWHVLQQWHVCSSGMWQLLQQWHVCSGARGASSAWAPSLGRSAHEYGIAHGNACACPRGPQQHISLGVFFDVP